jgi:dTDP-4-amino-4,6-dideoxygalactose transaminase
MVVTSDASRAERLRVFRAHGSKPKYYHHSVGGNFRLDAMQAAVVSAKLPHLDSWTDGRNRNAERYRDLFGASNLDVADSSEWAAARPAGTPLSGGLQLVLPAVTADRHVFNQYVIRVSSRDGLRTHLKDRGVGTEVYYPVPLHLQGCFAGLGYSAGDFPESELAAEETLALPIYPELSDDQAAYVVHCIREYFTGIPVSVAASSTSAGSTARAEQ